jgi:hypothetical protein
MSVKSLYEPFEQQIKEQLSNGMNIIEIMSIYKHFDAIKIQKIINKINKQSAPKKEKQIKKVNMIKANDERVKNRQLGKWGYSAIRLDDKYEITPEQNKAFWQCAKCEYILQNKAAAEECFNWHNKLETIKSKQDLEIGTIINVNIIKKIGFKYVRTYFMPFESEIVTKKNDEQQTGKFVYEVRPLKRLREYRD